MKNIVQLRDIIQEDLPIFFEDQMDKDAVKMAAFTSRDKTAFMEHWNNKILGDAAVIKKTILFQGNVAGNIDSWLQDGKYEVGYWIGKEYWGRGIASLALAEFLFIQNARPLYAHVAKHNKASLRVLEKCGFTITGEDKISCEAFDEEVEEFILKLDVRENKKYSVNSRQ